ncbi:MAG: hypothetical protein IJY86_10300 [Clostridia bacterium]|nr:hypothetical protein [Clostridia bacterium]
MKKTYVKPELVVESFQLDAAIAASCSSQGYIPINYGENNCTFDNGQFFNYNNCQMDLTGPEGDGNDAICYHGPLEAGMTFISS